MTRKTSNTIQTTTDTDRSRAERGKGNAAAPTGGNPGKDFTFKHFNIGQCIISLDEEISADGAMCSMLGYGQDETRKFKLSNILHPDDADEIRNLFYQLTEGQVEGVRSVARLIKRNGLPIFTEFVSNLQRDPEGNPLRILTSIIELPQKGMQALDQDRINTTLIQVLDRLPMGIAVSSIDPASGFIYMNDKFPSIYRTSRDAFTDPNSFWENAYEDPEFREQIKSRVMEDIASGDPDRLHWDEIPITRSGEGMTYVSATNIPIPELKLMISTVWDVTENRKAKEEYKKISDELHLIFKNMLNAMIIWESVFDNQGNYVSFRFGRFNEAYSRISGLQMEDVIGRDVFEVWPATEKSWVDIYGRVATTGQPEIFEMYHEPTKGWYHCKAFRPTDTPAYICVIFEDITLQKESEERLHQTQMLLNETQQISRVGGWEYDPDNRQMTWTEEMYRIFDVPTSYNPSDLDETGNFFAAGETRQMNHLFQETIRTGMPFDMDVSMKTSGGKYLWIHVNANAQVFDNRVVRVFGTVMDISDRKAIEMQLKEQLQELQRWQNVTLGREERIIELKKEVNTLLQQLGQPRRYQSVSTDGEEQ